MTGLLLIFALANLMILCGYVYLGAFVAPNFKIDRAGKISGAVFFITCGLTHVELFAHALLAEPINTLNDMTSWHMLAIHIPQAISVTWFVRSLHRAVTDAQG